MSVESAPDHERRRILTAAILGDHVAPAPADLSGGVVRGVLLDAGPGGLRLATPQGEESVVLDADTTVWRGREADTGVLAPGQDVVVRRTGSGQGVAERVWSGLARATGVIVATDGDTLEVDAGHDRERLSVVVPHRVSGRMEVRHPRLEPGELFDAIGVWADGMVQALMPATAQPAHRAMRPPESPPRRGRPTRVSGLVTWFDPVLGRGTDTDPLALSAGAAYPALDPVGGCGPACDRAEPCTPLPLLSTGAVLSLRNECNGVESTVAVTACGAAASHFCDRCVSCDSTDRGRITELSLASFVAMGGDPAHGCFNATMTT